MEDVLTLMNKGKATPKFDVTREPISHSRAWNYANIFGENTLQGEVVNYKELKRSECCA